jgi:DNA helicase-2/ATP-dependent DNA helicase PcrA
MVCSRADTQEILEGLTEPQRQAVTHGEGPLLVLAGPGSGKTRVITRRAAYLAVTRTQPRHILAITFTNKAAQEMADRMAALGVDRSLTVCTFHSLCARLLRLHADRAGLAPSFSIFDQKDRVQAVKEAIQRCSLSDANFQPSRVEHRISRFKNAMISPAQVEQDAKGFELRTLAKIYAAYEQVLAEQDALDFDDLLLRFARLLGEDAELRDQLEDRYRYLLVDEYQDTNHSQYLIARGLALTHHNLCVTGDPDQSIYGWRGANLGNILDFEEDFPDAVVVRLEQNYRSTKRILAAADAVIQRNRKRKAKALWTDNAEGTAVRVVQCEDAADEAAFVAGGIKTLHRQGVSYNGIAIFYRINALTRRLEEALRQAAIPYRIVRGVEFYSRKEIKDVTAYLRVLVNPNDEMSLLRIINTPARGIGKTTVDRLTAHARATGQPVSAWLSRAGQIDAIGSAAADRLAAFAKLMATLQPIIHGPARQAIDNVLTMTGLGEALEAEAENDSAPQENVNELITAAAEYDERQPDGTLVEWLQTISLTSDQDAYDSNATTVTLMTLHAAKGLEFPHVFIIGCEEGILPHQQRADSQADIEEERRLLFVGMTRAQQALTLTHARYREWRGMTQRVGPSKFLDELPREHIERQQHGGLVEHDSFDDLPQHGADGIVWREGQLVRHPTYGLGRLMWVQRRSKRTRAGIRFAAYGEKVMILEYAKLECINEAT